MSVTGWSALDRFLRTDPRDVGCAQAKEMLHVYVDLIAAGAAPAQRYPASPRTCARAARAVRTSKGCWLRRPMGSPNPHAIRRPHRRLRPARRRCVRARSRRRRANYALVLVRLGQRQRSAFLSGPEKR